MRPDMGHLTRRHLLQLGSLPLLGINVGRLARLRAATPDEAPAAKHRGNSCVFVFLFGGPSQIDLWDMKPLAPLNVRGEFHPVPTRVPGIQLCEHLPLLAQQMHRFCLLRSMTHRMNVHGPACSELFTGRPYPFPPTTDQARPDDWPSLSSLVMRFGRPRGGLPSSLVLPWCLQFPGQSLPIAGQSAGRMGRHHDAVLIDGDPSRDDFTIRGFQLGGDVSPERFQRRLELLAQFESRRRAARRTEPIERARDRDYGRAVELLESNAGRAFDLSGEPPSLRERYGPSKIAQSFLLARRLVERGAPLVSLNWEDETKIDGVNTCWDTHQQNFPKLKDLLCPMLDRCFSAFLEDLDQRGLLETTLVVAVGEFGRTPKLGEVTQSGNTQKTGRDHWPHAFTALLAGGGVRGGQVFGQTTRNASHVLERPVTPADLTATILHHLGVDATQEYVDDFQRIPHRLSEGTPVTDLG